MGWCGLYLRRDIKHWCKQTKNGGAGHCWLHRGRWPARLPHLQTDALEEKQRVCWATVWMCPHSFSSWSARCLWTIRNHTATLLRKLDKQLGQGTLFAVDLFVRQRCRPSLVSNGSGGAFVLRLSSLRGWLAGWLAGLVARSLWRHCEGGKKTLLPSVFERRRVCFQRTAGSCRLKPSVWVS